MYKQNVGIKGIVKPLMIHVKTVSSGLLRGSWRGIPFYVILLKN